MDESYSRGPVEEDMQAVDSTERVLARHNIMLAKWNG
jgi:hypothetical protein